MQEAKGKLIGKKGMQLSYGQWYPEDSPNAVIILVHGYAEHRGRYPHVIEAMVARGYAVFALDHRGHGASEGPRACVEHFDYFVEDLDLLVREATQAHPTLPLALYGHSMGGLIATRYALEHEKEVDALILSGAALLVGEEVSPLLKRVSSFLAKVAPRLPTLPSQNNVLSRDPEVERHFLADPLCYNGKVKARMGHEVLVASTETRERMGQLTLPMLIMHGEKDRLTSPEGSRRLYEQARSQDKTLKIWPGGFHEPHNDLQKEEAIALMLDWLDERVRLVQPLIHA